MNGNRSATSTLDIVSTNELFDNAYTGAPWIIEDLLTAGVYILAGAPKTGKSFLAMEMANCVATGSHLWEKCKDKYKAKKGTTLYLALEDDNRRIQQRFATMLGLEETENVDMFFATKAPSLEEGLLQELQVFAETHRKLKMIIIDTLQLIRRNAAEKYSYAADYEVISSLKEFSQTYGVCFLLIHHTRKKKADDIFQQISGTTGLLGAVDGALMMTKENRAGNNATLTVVGRDLVDQSLSIRFDQERCYWDLMKIETESWTTPPDPLLESINLLMNEKEEWEGTATELSRICNFKKDPESLIPPNVLTRRLNVLSSQLMEDYAIEYKSIRKHERMIYLKKIDTDRPETSRNGASDLNE